MDTISHSYYHQCMIYKPTSYKWWYHPLWDSPKRTSVAPISCTHTGDTWWRLPQSLRRHATSDTAASLSHRMCGHRGDSWAWRRRRTCCSRSYNNLGFNSLEIDWHEVTSSEYSYQILFHMTIWFSYHLKTTHSITYLHSTYKRAGQWSHHPHSARACPRLHSPSLTDAPL